MSTAADRLIPIPTTRMSNDAWKKLVDRFQLPAEARNSIDSAISFYILTGHATYSPSATKKRLREVAIIAAKLGKALKTVAADQLAIQALTHISVKKANVTQAIQERNVSQIIAADISAVEQLALSC